jgi:hypothetical protein
LGDASEALGAYHAGHGVGDGLHYDDALDVADYILELHGLTVCEIRVVYLPHYFDFWECF